MKKFILFAFILLSSIISNAQNYPGPMPELLLNKQLKVLPKEESSQKYGYRGFYTSITKRELYMENDNTTPYNELLGKVFTVTEVTPRTGIPGIYWLTLTSDSTPTLYYNYSSKHNAEYYFEVIGGLKMPEGYYCNKITSKQVPEGTMYQSEVVRGIILYKQPLAGKTTYMIHLAVFGDRAEVNKKGMIITLANGKVISKPQAEVNVTATNGFRYTSTTTLTTAEMKLLSESSIVRAKLFTFSEEKGHTEEIMEYAKCLLK